MMKLASVLFLPIVLIVGCSRQFNKVLKSKDYDYKLKMADKYYENKRYKNAEELYVELFPVFKGSDKFEELYYKYAYCSFYEKNYPDAENLFKGFLEVFPNSEKAEEIAYMHAYCFYLQSPRVELDQINTNKAIGMMQSFIGTHPNSARIKDANEIIAKCRAKLELKEYKSAQLYYDLQQYRAAGISFRDKAVSLSDLMSGACDERLRVATAPLFKSVGGGLQGGAGSSAPSTGMGAGTQ